MVSDYFEKTTPIVLTIIPLAWYDVYTIAMVCQNLRRKEVIE